MQVIPTVYQGRRPHPNFRRHHGHQTPRPLDALLHPRPWDALSTIRLGQGRRYVRLYLYNINYIYIVMC